MLSDPKLQADKEKSTIIFCLEDPFKKQTGYNLRVLQTISSLKDHRLYIISFTECPDKNRDTIIELKKERFSIIKIFKGYGLSANQSFLSKRNLSEAEGIINTIDPEYIIMEGFYFLGFFKLDIVKKHRVIVDLHNYEVERLISSLKANLSIRRRLLIILGLLEYLYYQRKYERYIWNYWIPTPEEKEKFCRLFKIKSDKIDVIANSVKTENNTPGDNIIGKRCSGKLLFTGNYSYPPNEEAANVIINKLMPELSGYNKSIKCYIAGPNLPDGLKNQNVSNVIATGYVENLSDYFKSAYIFIAPIAHGGGIKFKVIQALSYGLPVIGTKEALSGIDLSETKYFKPVLVKDFSKTIISLIENRDLYRSWAKEGYSLVKEQFSFEKIQRLISGSIRK